MSAGEQPTGRGLFQSQLSVAPRILHGCLAAYKTRTVAMGNDWCLARLTVHSTCHAARSSEVGEEVEVMRTLKRTVLHLPRSDDVDIKVAQVLVPSSRTPIDPRFSTSGRVEVGQQVLINRK